MRVIGPTGIFALLFLAGGSLFGAVTITTTSLPNGTVGQPYLTPQQTTVQLMATGGCGCPYQWSFFNMSPDNGDNLSFNSDGTITGTPSAPVTVTFQVQVFDVEDEETSSVVGLSITISGGTVTISTTSLPNGTVGKPYLVQLKATGGSGGPYQWTFSNFSSNNMDGLAFNSDGTITGTPATAVTLSFSVQAFDPATELNSNQVGLSITISASAAPPPPPPSCEPAIGPLSPLPSGDVSLFYSPVTFTLSHCPGPFTFSVSGVGSANALPPGMSLNGGVLRGTPTEAGAFNFVLTVTGPNQSQAQMQYAITIHPLPAITTASPLPSGTLSSLYSQQIAATGGVPPYTFSIDANPPGISISRSGLLSGTPLSTGTFPFNIGVTDNLGGQSSSPFQLSFAASFVNGTPDVQVSPLSLTFNADFQGNPPASQAIGVTPTTGEKAPVKFSVLIDNGQSNTAAPSWISVNPNSASAPAGLVVNVNQGNLAAGAYPARIRVLDDNNLPTDVSVTLNVQSTTQQLTVWPSILRFGVREAAPGILIADMLVSNTGAGTLAFNASVTDGSSWISSIAPSSGQTTLDAPALLQVQVNSKGLAVGSYHDTIHVASPAGNVDIPISLFVSSSGPVLSVGSTGVFFHARQNGGTSAIGHIEILNIGDSNSTVNWTASLISGSNWLHLVSSSGTATASTPGVLTIAPVQNATQLAIGPYYALIQIADSNSLNSPQFAIAVLNIEPDSAAPTPDATPGGLFFTPVDGSAPPAQQVVINTSSATPVSFVVATTTTDQGAWLSATPSSGNASGKTSGNISVSVDLAGLAAGIYTGEVSVSIGQALESVNVTFVVQPGSASTAIAQLRPEVSGCTPSKLAITENGLVNNFAVPAGWPATLIVQLNDNCGSPVTNGSVTASFSNGDAPLVLAGDSLGNYSATWQPGAVTSEMVVTLNAASGNLQSATAKLYGGISLNETPPPTLSPGGILNNFNPVVGGSLSPGIIAQVFGTGLAASSGATGTLPLPTTFNNTFAQVGQFQAPLYFLSSGQLNVQLPSEIATSQQVPIVLSVNNALTLPISLDLVPSAPGVMSLFDGPTPPSVQNGAHIIAQHLNGTTVNSNSPGKPGEYLVMYLVGLGATDPSVPSGMPASSNPLSKVTIQPTVMVDSVPSNVAFAGLTPGFVGLYQIDFQVPTSVTTGEAVVTVSQGGIAANPTLLAVSQ